MLISMGESIPVAHLDQAFTFPCNTITLQKCTLTDRCLFDPSALFAMKPSTIFYFLFHALDSASPSPKTLHSVDEKCKISETPQILGLKFLIKLKCRN